MRGIRVVVLLAVLPAAWVHASVQWQGALHKVHHGDASATLRLSDIKPQDGLLALGPVADLGGEITVLDGEVFVSRVTEHRLPETAPENDVPAAFLVWAHVPSWQPAQTVVADIGSLA